MLGKHQYGKAAAISISFHALLFGFFLIAGHMLLKPSIAAAPIEVEVFSVGAVNDNSDSELMSENPSLEKNETRAVMKSNFSQEKTQLHPASHANSSAPVTKETDGTEQNYPMNNAATASSSSGLTAALPHNNANTKVQGTSAKRTSTRTEPCCITRSQPPYPKEAILYGWEGSVVVRVLVGTDGLASMVTVRTSSGYKTLDDTAAEAVRRWRFSPARIDDNPVESYYDVRVKFSLDEAES